MRHFCMLWLLLAVVHGARSAEQFVSFSGGDLLLNDRVEVALYVDPADERGVAMAARNVAADLHRVCNYLFSVADKADGARIVAGTVGHSKAIDALGRAGKLDLSALKGRREKFLITLVDQQLVIAGSDRRGTIYGLYELSRQAGVSPWHFWADVPVRARARIYIKKGVYTDGEPAVRYRGLFLNDEAPCLTTWVHNTYGTDYGDHRFYEKVFELILRLRGNFLWPAMWGWAFYADDPDNSRLADEMGVMIGTSHHEPMARNHQEYARHREEWGPWNYRTNARRLDDFFRQGIERIKGTEDVVTIGMRGDGDEAMSAEADTRLLQDVVNSQRRIIREVTGRPASQTPQVWALYKEVLDYYDAGMKVPDDVLMLLCDDNWGNVRRVPNARERRHKGGWGLYYHVDYVGAPRNSKWLCATPIQHMWEQLLLAWKGGLDRMWILNVGDLKPMEYPIQLFMDMAWAPESVATPVDGELPGMSTMAHTLDFCRASFGDEQAREAARILDKCAQLNGRSTAEMLDDATYAVDEWPRVVGEYDELELAALRQYAALRTDQRDAYFQLVLFPVQAMANLHRLYRAVAMNKMLYAQQDPGCNLWADRAEEAFRRDSVLARQYNRELAGGKWNGMMTQKHIGYTSWNDDFAPADVMPQVFRLPDGVGRHCFAERDGMVVMEAEHFFEKRDDGALQWTVVPGLGRTLSGLALMPYGQWAPSKNGPSLLYRFHTEHAAGQVLVVVKSTLDYLNQGGLRFQVSVDGKEPREVNFNHRLNEQPENIYTVYYPTVARRVVACRVEEQIPAGEHTLCLRPLDPAIVFEKVVVDCGGYHEQFLFGEESPRQRTD